ncbi:MAG: hypothetical protein IPI93_11280 [Sphingobacteriaceae bacterium]|nr:hypothetical protein [Sphingobacteriaceae bacterium]
MPFEEARELVRGLKLNSTIDWRNYTKTSLKPFDIPSFPQRVYDKEWLSMGDWLGTYRIADQLKEYRSFEEARAFVHLLNLKNQADWIDYCKSPKFPTDIPKNPNQTYKDKGWNGMGDWIGTYTIAPNLRNYREFNLARKYVHSLNLKNRKEWNNYYESGKMPADIPMTPNVVYKDSGWKSMGDWLGTDFVATYMREYLPFLEARKYIHSLKFNSNADWLVFCKSGKKPSNIPAKPGDVYHNFGWKSLGDWLGTNTISNANKEFKSFNEAREFVHSLKLKSQKDWRLYCKSGKKPDYIPSDPHHVYKNSGWISNGDWLGTGRVADKYRVYLPFEDAREYARALKFKNQIEWQEYCKSGKKPDNIPYSPSDAYKGKGFAGIADFLGYGNAKPDQLLSFHEAKKYLKKYGFKNQKEFIEAKKGNKITNRIPVLADRKYKDQGWAGWGDFLGSGNVGKYNDLMPFEEAREYAQKLGFKTADEWKDFMRSKKKPANIPVSPMVPYKDKWKGWGDFLGTGKIADMNKVYLPFKEAREFARKLGIKSTTEWKLLHKSKNKPNSIPVNADRRYKNEGWLGWKDFLGNK